MANPNEIEALLNRLAPAALSTQGTEKMHDMLDALAQTTPIAHGEISSIAAEVPSPQAVRITSRRFWLSAAACLALASSLPLLLPEPPAPQSTTAETIPHPHPAVTLLSETDRIQSISDEDHIADLDGAALQTIRVELVEQDQWLDEETGILMDVSFPREEILLMPISTF